MPVPRHLSVVRDSPPLRGMRLREELAAVRRIRLGLAGVGALLAILFVIWVCR